HPDDAVVRIAKEQTGIDIKDTRLDHIESFTGGDGSWHLIFHYACFPDKLPEINPSSDILTSSWFAVNALPSDEEIAHHGWAKYILGVIMEKIR
ncbi:MAG TPA: NUDIX hydrolase, partial [Ignavibacteria bacterium]